VFEFLLIVTLTLGPNKVERLYYASSQLYGDQDKCIAKGKRAGDTLLAALAKVKPKLKAEASVGCSKAGLTA
jgi:hypothetical protein